MTMVLSHSKAEVKAKLMVHMLGQLMQTEWSNIHHYIPILEELSLLSGKGNMEIALMVSLPLATPSIYGIHTLTYRLAKLLWRINYRLFSKERRV